MVDQEINSQKVTERMKKEKIIRKGRMCNSDRSFFMPLNLFNLDEVKTYEAKLRTEIGFLSLPLSIRYPYLICDVIPWQCGYTCRR